MNDETLFEIAEKINDYILSNIDEQLIPRASACVCDADGEIDKDTEPVGHVGLYFDIERWHEGSRPISERGRAELRDEASEADRILEFVGKFGVVEKAGDGDGSFGPIDMYELRIS